MEIKPLQNSLLASAVALSLIFVGSCSSDDGGSPALPTISADPTTATVAPGESLTITLTVTQDGTGTVTGTDGTDALVITNNTVEYSVAIGAISGSTITLTFSVSDGIGTATAQALITVGDKSVETIAPAGGNITENTTWTADKIYLLDGLVFVTNDATLTIEPGTIIKASSTPSNQSDNTSALIITRGAKIMAEGKASNPITFTAESDDLAPGTLDWNDTRLWGGLIVLGNARVAKNGSEGQIEGLPSDDVRGKYGGDSDTDNSGIIKYVSIRHSGIALAPGEEIQGLTLGGVGNGTTIEYLEVYGSADDGIEFFGGTVLVNYAVIAGAEDDSFDWDEGYRGGGQFWFALQREDVADHACECDGAVPDSGLPQSEPTVFNATFIGSGIDSNNPKNALAVLMRDNTGGTFGNSIIVDYRSKGIEVEDLEAAKGDDSYAKIGSQLNILNNIWFVGGHTTLDTAGIIQLTSDDGSPVGDDPAGTNISTHIGSTNSTMDPEIIGISRALDGGLDPRPGADTSADLATTPAGYQTTSYKGAFDPAGDLWIAGWTALSEKGHL